MKRVFALLLCAALLLALLAGCGQKSGDTQGNSDEAPAAETAAETAEEAGDQPLVSDPDAGSAIGLGGTGYATYAPDTVVADVNGSEVTWMEYYYWLTYYGSMLLESAIENNVTLTSWDAVGEMSMDMSNAEVLTTAAQYMMKQYHAIQTGAESIDAALSEQDRADLEDIYTSYADSDGDGAVSEEEAASYDRFLAGQCVDKDFFLYLLETAMLTNVVFDSLYGESAEKYTDDDTMAFIAENGYMSARRIVILTIDSETGEDLDEETIAQKKAIADWIRQELAAKQDTDELIELFDEYMYEYSEDTGYADFPDGYVFLKDGTPLSTITAKLDENYGLSEVEETSYGYEIVLRQPVLPDSVESDAYGEGRTMRYLAAERNLQVLVSAWTDAAEVTWNEGFETPDLAAIFG